MQHNWNGEKMQMLHKKVTVKTPKLNPGDIVVGTPVGDIKIQRKISQSERTGEHEYRYVLYKNR